MAHPLTPSPVSAHLADLCRRRRRRRRRGFAHFAHAVLVVGDGKHPAEILREFPWWFPIDVYHYMILASIVIICIAIYIYICSKSLDYICTTAYIYYLQKVKCDRNSLPVLLKEDTLMHSNGPRLKSSCSNLAIAVRVKNGFPTSYDRSKAQVSVLVEEFYVCRITFSTFTAWVFDVYVERKSHCHSLWEPWIDLINSTEMMVGDVAMVPPMSRTSSVMSGSWFINHHLPKEVHHKPNLALDGHMHPLVI